jgi:hypothetical protein
MRIHLLEEMILGGWEGKGKCSVNNTLSLSKSSSSLKIDTELDHMHQPIIPYL